MTTITVKQTHAVDLLHSIIAPWSIKGGAFFNDYASLKILIDGDETPHRLILHRNGTWEFTAEVAL